MRLARFSLFFSFLPLSRNTGSQQIEATTSVAQANNPATSMLQTSLATLMGAGNGVPASSLRRSEFLDFLQGSILVNLILRYVSGRIRTVPI
jgi:hypothetical protein